MAPARHGYGAGFPVTKVTSGSEACSTIAPEAEDCRPHFWSNERAR